LKIVRAADVFAVAKQCEIDLTGGPLSMSALPCRLGLHMDGGAVHAGGLEQRAEYLGGPFGAVEGIWLYQLRLSPVQDETARELTSNGLFVPGGATR